MGRSFGHFDPVAVIGAYVGACSDCDLGGDHLVCQIESHRVLFCRLCKAPLRQLPRKALVKPIADADSPLTVREQAVLLIAASWLGTSPSDDPTDAEIHSAFDFADRAAGIFLARRKGA